MADIGGPSLGGERHGIHRRSSMPIQLNIWTLVNVITSIGAVTTAPLTLPATGPDVDICCEGADCALIPDMEATELAEVFKALADPTRVRLLDHLSRSVSGTACACHLPESLGISQPTLSFHMKKLHDAGLVTREKRGRWVHWTVRPEALARAVAYLGLPAHGIPAGGACC